MFGIAQRRCLRINGATPGLFFKSLEVTRSSYSDYRPNDLVVTELLSK